MHAPNRPPASDPEAAAWLALLRASGRRPATLSTYRWAIDHLATWWDQTGHEAGLETLTRAEAVAYVESLRFRLKPASVSVAVRPLKTFYRHLVNEEVIRRSPFERVTISIPEEVRPAMTEEDIEAMASRARDAKDRALLYLMADTGCRKGEVANLDLSDIDLTSGVVTYRVSKTQPRSVPLSDRAVLHLTRYLRKRGTRSGSLWCFTDGYTYVRRAVKVMSESRWSPHDLRRFFAISWLAKGGSESGLMRICGWSDTTMIRHYTRASADLLAADEYRRLLG